MTIKKITLYQRLQVREKNMKLDVTDLNGGLSLVVVSFPAPVFSGLGQDGRKGC